MTDGPEAPCPPDSDLMKAWKAHQETEDFKNSFNWATRLIGYDNDRSPNGDQLRATDRQRSQWVKGSLWACFVAGFVAAGGKTTR